VTLFLKRFLILALVCVFLFTAIFKISIFESNWTNKTKNAGWGVIDGKWEQKGQFMTGSWHTDLDSYLLLISKQHNINMEAGVVAEAIFNIFPLGFPYVVYPLTHFLSKKSTDPLEATVTEASISYRMGRNYEEATKNFWNLVRESYFADIDEPVEKK
jgi:hypothetical protein